MMARTRRRQPTCPSTGQAKNNRLLFWGIVLISLGVITIIVGAILL